MPMLHRRRLARELHQLRVRAGLTVAELAQEMDCSASKINRMETGNFPIAPGDARELARIYGLGAEQQNQLTELARASRRKGWWDAYSDVLPPARVRYLGLESAAAQIRIYDIGALPGLLQAPAYARAITDAGMPGAPAAEAARLVRMQLSRQLVLTGPHPAAVAVVVDEAAIRRQVGGPEVMRSQLRHLLAVPPNLVVQILPFSAGPAHPSGDRSSCCRSPTPPTTTLRSCATRRHRPVSTKPTRPANTASSSIGSARWRLVPALRLRWSAPSWTSFSCAKVSSVFDCSGPEARRQPSRWLTAAALRKACFTAMPLITS